MWELWTPAPAQVDVTAVRDAPAADNPGVRVHRSRVLHSSDVPIRQDLPVLSPARTLLRHRATDTARPLELASDRAIVHRLLQPADVAAVLKGAGGHRGRRRLVRLVARDGAICDTSHGVRADVRDRELSAARVAPATPRRGPQTATALASAIGNRRMSRLLNGDAEGLAQACRTGPPGPRTVAARGRLQRQPTATKTKPKPKSPPVAGGNILYIGMNNFGPEIRRLLGIYAGTSVTVTSVTVTDDETKTKVGSTTYDLTGNAGIEAYASSLGLSDAGRDQVKALLTSQSSEDRDDLAHVISVYAACEGDGVDRMSRIVLSGHSYGTKVYNEDVHGAIYFDALVKLASIFPKAAAQTRHLMVLACLAGEENTITNLYLKAFPNLQTFWGWTNTCPTGAGAAAALANWSRTTDKNPTKLDPPPAGQANWAVGVYQTDEPVDGPVLMSGLRSDEAKFNRYFSGETVDPDSHTGFLFDYYRRSRLAAAHTSTITGADHAYAQLHADQSYRLRFWRAMVSRFWKKNRAAIVRGYGTAKTPDYGTMTRKDTLASIADFDAASSDAERDRAGALRLLHALRDLDPAELNDNWLTP